MPDFIASVVKVLTASGRVGFALLFGGILILAFKSYNFWPFGFLPDDQLPWAAVAAIFGGGLILADILIWMIRECLQPGAGLRIRQSDGGTCELLQIDPTL